MASVPRSDYATILRMADEDHVRTADIARRFGVVPRTISIILAKARAAGSAPAPLLPLEGGGSGPKPGAGAELTADAMQRIRPAARDGGAAPGAAGSMLPAEPVADGAPHDGIPFGSPDPAAAPDHVESSATEPPLSTEPTTDDTMPDDFPVLSPWLAPVANSGIPPGQPDDALIANNGIPTVAEPDIGITLSPPDSPPEAGAMERGQPIQPTRHATASPKPAKPGTGSAAKADLKSAYGLVARTSDGDEAVTPFGSLDELLSSMRGILRNAAREPEPVWFSIREIDRSALDDF